MPDRPPSSRARVEFVAIWVLRVLLAAYFVYSGALLFGDSLVAKFDEIGFGQWLRYVTGVLEIAGAIGLLIPRLSGPAALGLFGVMVGAVGTELFLIENGGPILPAILGLLALVIAWFQRDSTLRLIRQDLTRTR